MESNGEKFIVDTLLPHLNPVVFDVGAGTGKWSELCSDKDIHAFEPIMDYASQIDVEGIERHNLAFTLNHFALGETATTTPFIYSENLCPSARWLGEIENNKCRDVQVSTVDEYAKARQINMIGYLKIDAEGMDLDVLKGAKEMLEAHRIQALQFEYSDRWIFSRQLLLDAFNFLTSLDYRVSLITSRGLINLPKYDSRLEDFRLKNFFAISLNS